MEHVRTVVNCETGEVREEKLKGDELEEAKARAEEPVEQPESLEDQIYRMVDEALKERGQ